VTTDERLELPGSTQALLDAVMAISSDLDQLRVLTHIVEAPARSPGRSTPHSG
jgi:hypothetical protein